MTNNAPFLEVLNIGLKVENKDVLSGISFKIEKGEIAVLIGPNGSGKTSLARIILGLLESTHGNVRLSAKKIGYMPQKVAVDRIIPMTAYDFLSLSGNKFRKHDNSKKVQNLLSVFALNDILSKQVSDLSGGQMQKLVFLRAILDNPDFLVLDEPTQFMDVQSAEEFYKQINEIRLQTKCTILLISHDLHVVMKKADTVICLNGHICCVKSMRDEDSLKCKAHLSESACEGNACELGVYHHRHNHTH